MHYAYGMKRMRGFTIVEIVVVIAVIGVLTTIGAIGYNQLHTKVSNDSITSEANLWISLMRQYKQRYGTLPAVSSGNYCLTTNQTSRPCRSPFLTTWSDPSPVLNELKKIGQLPDGKSYKVFTDTSNRQFAGFQLNASGGSLYEFTFFLQGENQKCPNQISMTTNNMNGLTACDRTGLNTSAL